VMIAMTPGNGALSLEKIFWDKAALFGFLSIRPAHHLYG